MLLQSVVFIKINLLKMKRQKLYDSIMRNINNSFKYMKLNENTSDFDYEEDLIDEENKFENMTIDEYWDNLISNYIATEDELKLVTSINGYTIETLDDVLYVRTGYRSWEQYYTSEGE